MTQYLHITPPHPFEGALALMDLHADFAAFNMTSDFFFHETSANTFLRESLNLWKAAFFSSFYTLCDTKLVFTESS